MRAERVCCSFYGLLGLVPQNACFLHVLERTQSLSGPVGKVYKPPRLAPLRPFRLQVLHTTLSSHHNQLSQLGTTIMGVVRIISYSVSIPFSPTSGIRNRPLTPPLTATAAATRGADAIRTFLRPRSLKLCIPRGANPSRLYSCCCNCCRCA